MKPIKHASNNIAVIPPQNWDDRAGKLRIPAMDATKGSIHGVDVFVTWWKPSEDDLMCLLRGGLVQLSCIGGQPALNLCAADDLQAPAIMLAS